MLGPLNEALERYFKKWHALCEARQDRVFFGGLKPTAAAWKTEDLAEFDLLFKQFKPISSQIHVGWVNERWIATFVLRDPAKLCCSIPIVKLMQRRPESNDPVGLDHVDFYSPAAADADLLLTKENDLKWSHETNGEYCKWTSIWFGGTEAKLRTDTTLSPGIKELADAEKQILEN